MASETNGAVANRDSWKDRTWVLWLVFTLLLALFLRGPELLSQVWGNTGMTMLARGLTAAPEGATQAELLLRRAVAHAPENRSAWRGLGLALAAQGEDDEAIAAWRSGGLSAKELRDQWYYMGLAYETSEQWEEALRAYEQAVEIRDLTDVDQSDPYYRMGMIYHRKLAPPQLENALAAYEAALAADDFSTTKEAADCHYRRGEILRWQEANPDEYIAEYQQAIALDPRHTLARIWLGTSYYTRDGDAARAEAEIRQALELDPQNHYAKKWAYVHLGDIHRQEGWVDEALVLYKQALEIDPEFEAAHKRLLWLSEGE